MTDRDKQLHNNSAFDVFIKRYDRIDKILNVSTVQAIQHRQEQLNKLNNNFVIREVQRQQELFNSMHNNMACLSAIQPVIDVMNNIPDRYSNIVAQCQPFRQLTLNYTAWQEIQSVSMQSAISALPKIFDLLPLETVQNIFSPDFSHMVTCIQDHLDNVQPAFEILKGVPFSAWEEFDREITELEVSDEGQANINNILWENFSDDLRERLIAIQSSVSEKITIENINVLVWIFDLLIPHQTDLSIKQTLESIKQALYCILITLAVIPKKSK